VGQGVAPLNEAARAEEGSDPSLG